MPAQIFSPQVGRTYRITSGEYTFVGRVTAWDLDTVTVKVDPHDTQKDWPESLRLKRSAALFQDWL